MFQVLVPTPTRKAVVAFERRREDRPTAKPMAGVGGAVDFGKVAVFSHMRGQLIRCESGSLWVTVEDDRTDHVLFPRQCLFIPTEGKVVIGGKGSFTV
jgi:hypothetical protein